MTTVAGSAPSRASRATPTIESSPDPEFSETLELDLSTVVPSLAGPMRPQDQVPLDRSKELFRDALVEITNGDRPGGGKAEEESDTVVVSATTTTRPVGVWASSGAARHFGDAP